MFALDAIQIPMSLQEPVYNDGGDALYVMDQLSDQTNKEEKWVEKPLVAVSERQKLSNVYDMILNPDDL